MSHLRPFWNGLSVFTQFRIWRIYCRGVINLGQVVIEFIWKHIVPSASYLIIKAYFKEVLPVLICTILISKYNWTFSFFEIRINQSYESHIFKRIGSTRNPSKLINNQCSQIWRLIGILTIAVSILKVFVESLKLDIVFKSPHKFIPLYFRWYRNGSISVFLCLQAS